MSFTTEMMAAEETIPVCKQSRKQRKFHVSNNGVLNIVTCSSEIDTVTGVLVKQYNMIILKERGKRYLICSLILLSAQIKNCVIHIYLCQALCSGEIREMTW